ASGASSTSGSCPRSMVLLRQSKDGGQGRVYVLSAATPIGTGRTIRPLSANLVPRSELGRNVLGKFGPNAEGGDRTASGCLRDLRRRIAGGGESHPGPPPWVWRRIRGSGHRGSGGTGGQDHAALAPRR